MKKILMGAAALVLAAGAALLVSPNLRQLLSPQRAGGFLVAGPGDCLLGSARACAQLEGLKRRDCPLEIATAQATVATAMKALGERCPADPTACRSLGWLELHQTGASDGYDNGYQRLSALCEKGDPSACHILGVALRARKNGGAKALLARAGALYAERCEKTKESCMVDLEVAEAPDDRPLAVAAHRQVTSSGAP